MILPPYGLSGGNMRFEPGSLVLFIDDSLELLNSYLSGKDLKSSTQPIRIRSRFVHERDHFFRHLTSSYGMVRNGLHSLMVRQFFAMVMRKEVDGSFSSDGVLGSEIKALFNKNPPAEVIQKLTQIDSIRPSLMYLSAIECIRALDGDQAFLDRSMAQGGIVVFDKVARTIAKKEGEIASYYQADANPPVSLARFFDPADDLVPVVKGKPFAASHLLEFFGIVIELAYLSNQGMELLESTDLLDVQSYFRVGSVFFGEFFGQELEAGRYPAFPVELEAAVDLALAIPITPSGIQTAGRLLTWYDLHPGWRFLAICQYFKDSRKSWTTIPPDENSFAGYDLAFRTIQAEVSHALGWPKPEAIEGEWKTLLDEIQEKPILHPLAMDLRGSGRQRIARFLFEERKQSPYSMYLKRRRGAVDRELFFPSVISREGMTTFGKLHWTTHDGEPTHWDEFLMFTGCRFFAEGFPEHPHVRYDQAVSAAELISRCSTGFGAERDHVETILAKFLSLNSYRKFEADILRCY